MKQRTTSRDVLLLLGLTVAAFVVHGYHPYVEDAEIYLPGIKKMLHPEMYAQNTGFFASHAGMTLFPNLIAASIRVTHLPFDWALLLWQFLCVFFLLLASWRIGRLLLGSKLAAWGGAALVASLLTLPVAGTALYIMDQYLNTRSLSAAAVMMMVASIIERRYIPAVLWGVFTAAVHPLMFVFGAGFGAILFLVRLTPVHKEQRDLVFAALLPLSLFPPMSPQYHEALLTRSYFFLARWAWYEWLGLLAPFAVFWCFGRIARKRNLLEMEQVCRAANIFSAIMAVASLLTMLPAFERFTLLQPMRYLHPMYILMAVLGGGLLAQSVLQRHAWRWLVLFVPLCGGMFYAQRQVFPGSQHLELPWRAPSNPWVQAFVWIRQNTPPDAYFALNPRHMDLQGEDEHGFRALSERSMLADAAKDSGVVTMFPAMADTWKEQMRAQAGWSGFQRQDFARLHRDYGVTWVVLDQGNTLGLACPYRNQRVEVCRVD
ncbi:MAG: hypothetical protein P4M01_10825 [Acidobacteriota bacterium]|nr:hypothetical protein [Acidobacteriota bacterium]